MDAIEHLKERTFNAFQDEGGMTGLDGWKNYIGPDVEGYIVISTNRDANTLTRANWESACKSLDADNSPHVSIHGFTHWACGWYELLIVAPDAPESVLKVAAEIICALADYPVLDDELYSQMEHDERAEYLDNGGLSDAFALLGCSDYSRFDKDSAEYCAVWDAAYDSMANFGECHIDESFLRENISDDILSEIAKPQLYETAYYQISDKIFALAVETWDNDINVYIADCTDCTGCSVYQDDETTLIDGIPALENDISLPYEVRQLLNDNLDNYWTE